MEREDEGYDVHSPSVSPDRHDVNDNVQSPVLSLPQEVKFMSIFIVHIVVLLELLFYFSNFLSVCLQIVFNFILQCFFLIRQS